jgi:hypothetical protein
MNSACKPPEFCNFYGCGAARIEITLQVVLMLLHTSRWASSCISPRSLFSSSEYPHFTSSFWISAGVGRVCVHVGDVVRLQLVLFSPFLQQLLFVFLVERFLLLGIAFLQGWVLSGGQHVDMKSDSGGQHVDMKSDSGGHHVNMKFGHLNNKLASDTYVGQLS